MMKKISILLAMMALMMVTAVPAFASHNFTIDVGEGDVTLTNESSITDSIVQNCGAVVSFGDENENVQVVNNAQNTTLDIEGDENEVEISQGLTQSGFSPSVETSCTQSVAQAVSLFWLF